MKSGARHLSGSLALVRSLVVYYPLLPPPQKDYKIKECPTEAQASDLGPEHRKGKLNLDEQSSVNGSD